MTDDINICHGIVFCNPMRYSWLCGPTWRRWPRVIQSSFHDHYDDWTVLPYNATVGLDLRPTGGLDQTEGLLKYEGPVDAGSMEVAQRCLSLANRFHVKTNLVVYALASIDLNYLLGAYALAWVAGTSCCKGQSLVAMVLLAFLQVRRCRRPCTHGKPNVKVARKVCICINDEIILENSTSLPFNRGAKQTRSQVSPPLFVWIWETCANQCTTKTH